MSHKRNNNKRKVLYYIRKLFGDKFLNNFLSLRNLGYLPKLSEPKTFNEKIQWIKLYSNLEELGKYVDKFTVRDYVKRKVGKDALIPLLKVFHNKKEVDYNKLPNKFIMKAAHGSGWNYIVNDLRKEDVSNLQKLSKEWLNKNYYEETGERNYKKIKPKIVIEKLLEVPGRELDEYKVHCFNGKPKIIQYFSYEDGIKKSNVYTINWEKLPTSKGYPNFAKNLTKPKKLEKIIDLAKKLSEDFIYVRVDLYDVESKIYFGELTFTPAGGVSAFSDIKYDEKIGSFLKVQKDILIT